MKAILTTFDEKSYSCKDSLVNFQDENGKKQNCKPNEHLFKPFKHPENYEGCVFCGLVREIK